MWDGDEFGNYSAVRLKFFCENHGKTQLDGQFAKVKQQLRRIDLRKGALGQKTNQEIVQELVGLGDFIHYESDSLELPKELVGLQRITARHVFERVGEKFFIDGKGVGLKFKNAGRMGGNDEEEEESEEEGTEKGEGLEILARRLRKKKTWRGE